MDIYKIADLNIGVNNHSHFTKEYMKDYLSDSTTADFCVSITEDMIQHEKQLVRENIPDEYHELTAILRSICATILERYNGFFLHCSSLEYDGGAYIFTAKSGTGKSTHARLWREAFPDKVTMINDDKPIVRLIDGAFYVYGTPWNGKHSISNNIKVPIKAIYYLSQSENNKCTRCDSILAISKLLSQTILPDDSSNMDKLLSLLEELVLSTPMYDLECNISHDAVYTALNSTKE